MAVPDWWNELRYRLYAPVYDLGAKPIEGARERALERVDVEVDERVLIVGSGTGMDLSYLPREASVTALDLTPAMVRRTERRAQRLGVDVDAQVADARSLPFEDDTFDVVLLHLVLSVIPQPARVASEAARVFADDGRVSILDKFVEEGATPSPLRRAANPLARLLFADLNRSLEPMLAETSLESGPCEPFLGGLYTMTTTRVGAGRRQQ